MKISEQQGLTFIYPYLSQDGEAEGPLTCLVIYPEGTINLNWYDAVMMDAEHARMLAKALLYAVEMAEGSSDEAL